MIVIYTKEYCGYCLRAKGLLKRKGLEFTEIDVSDAEKYDEMVEKSGRQTVPQIFINDKHIGGSDDLFDLDQSGELDKMLKN